jgi:hypothetical protein
VIEVCRKAATPREAGPDFTELDLLKLTDFGRVLATYVVRFRPDDFRSCVPSEGGWDVLEW